MRGVDILTNAPAHSAEAEVVFGPRLDLARRYADLLATLGIERGLLGPREADRLWPRHLVNCAVVGELLPADARAVDVGSGAGLPGVALAISRPDLRIQLVEPLLRRAEFLSLVVGELGLSGSVEVLRGRAEERSVLANAADSDWVLARAVAPLDRLVGWCLPLLRPGGRLLALKGLSAEAEVAQYSKVIKRLGASAVDVVQCGVGVAADPTTVVRVQRGDVRKGGKR